MNLVGYRDFKKLAEGHQHAVYSCLRECDSEEVILKTLRAEYPNSDEIALLHHEYEVSKDLQGLPGIINVYDFVIQENKYVLILENMHGISLQEFLQKKPINNLADFFKLALSMVQIIGELHQHHIIHKDIKPSNFIIHPETGLVKLTDLSFSSKLLHETQDMVPPERLEGTLSYMAPEQTGRMNKNIDYRVDFYSLGVTFYQMLSGSLPFIYNDPLELLHAHLANSPPEVSSRVFDIPSVLVEILQKLMAKNPGDRYQSVIGLKVDLERCQNELENTGSIESFPLGESDVFDRLNLSQHLYGREEEVKLLLAAYQRSSEGSVETLMVCGYSGIGKTMLINEVHKPMVQHKGHFISGKFEQLQRNTPYTAITQAFNQLARSILMEPEDRFAAIKNELILALSGVGQLMIDLAPDIELIIGPQPPLELLPPQESQIRMLNFFSRFLKAVANKDHPMVLFIDDLQWIDSGSLRLLEHIMMGDDLTHILLIGAYRDNQVDEYHPLKLLFNSMQAKGKNIGSLPLAPLTITNFESLFKDSFNRNDIVLKPFAELIHKRTKGNPFFCKQVIGTLYKEKLLYFDYEKSQWAWDLEGVTALKITDNVVDLMISKLVELPAKTQLLLKYAACMGTRFRMDMLLIISGNSADIITKALWPALENEFIVSLRQGHKKSRAMHHEHEAIFPEKNITYQFIHDRVQQAVYQGIPTSEKQKIHLTIAQLLQEKEPEACKKELFYELVDHYNHGHSLLKKNEKIAVAILNYQAGVNAKNANAYQSMETYLGAAVKLAGKQSWETQYEFTFKLYCEYAVSLFLMNQDDKAEELIENLLLRVKNDLEKVKLYQIRIQNYVRKQAYHKLLSTMKLALALMGVTYPERINSFMLLSKLLRVRWRMRRIDLETLEHELPVLSNPTIRAVFEILIESANTLANIDLLLGLYLGLKVMELQFTYGKPPGMGLWLVYYGCINLFVFKNISYAFRCWSAAERLFIEFPNKYLSSTALFTLGNFYHLRYPFQICEQLELNAIEQADESGNLYALRGSKHILLLCEMAKARTARKIVELNQPFLIDSKGVMVNTELTGILFENVLLGLDNNEDKINFLLNKVGKSKMTYDIALCFRGVAAYYYFRGAFEKAIPYYERWYLHQTLTEFHLDSCRGKTTYPLALAELIPKTRGYTRWRYLRRFNRLLIDLKKFSDSCPQNYKHNYLLVKGAQLNLKGQFKESLICFDQAIENAKKNDFYLWIALGNELAGAMLVEQNLPRCGLDYIREAHYYYGRYEDTFKVKNLEQRYPKFFAEPIEISSDGVSSMTSKFHSISTTSTSYDFMSVIKASQTISGEIVLGQLFEKMLHIVVENAGAERALFLENRKNTWMVTAILAKQEGVEVFNMLDVSLEEYQTIAHKVIKYVQRSAESVIISNAVEDQSYNDDPYIVQAKIKSILCVPIVLQDKVLGIIYLENNLSVGAFTQERVTVLSTLASQIAISLENARHFEVMEQLYRSTERFVPRGFLNLLNKKTIEEIKVGDSVEVNLAPMFADVRNFTTISEALGTEKTAYLLNAYMQLMSPIIRKHHGFVSQFFGDGIMALFPRHHVDALDAAIQMRSALVGFNEMIQSKGFDPIEIGIGINAGPAMLITLGEEERIDASVVSDVVNSASRIEGLNKFYGTGLLISDAVFASIKNPEQYVMRLVDKVRVKGRVQAMFIYEVMTLDHKEDLVQTREYIQAFEAAFKRYEAGDFKTAASEFATCFTTRPDDRVAMVLKSRCEDLLLSELPQDWDGSYNALDK